MNADLKLILQSKELRRRQLAHLPFHEKVRIVIQLQQMAAPILRARGRAVQPWSLATVSAAGNGDQR